MHKNEKGFSLIELLIVVAIILIIAAIAIPDLMKSRIAAAESAVVGNLRAANTGAFTYSTSINPAQGFPMVSTAQWTEVTDPSLSAALGVAGGIKGGYKYTYTPVASAGVNVTYTIVAVPQAIGSTGKRGFYTDESGVIRYTLDGTAPTSVSPTL